MSNLVIINGVAAYDYEAAILYNLEKPDEPVNLYAPTNECLYILLSKYPDTIPQSYFFENAWEKSGLTTTVNNFYQHISMLRRAFDVVGIDESTIITVPRRGVSLSKVLDLKYVDIEDKSIKNGNTINNIPLPEHSTKKRINTKLVILSCIVLIVFSAVLSVLSLSMSDEPNASLRPITNYLAAGNVGSCQLFSLSENYNLDEVKAMINSYKIDCTKESNLYYSTLPFINRESLIYCNQVKGIENGCVSYFTIK